jgi:ATP-dependent DNA helicase RecG
MEREGSGFDLIYDRLLSQGRPAPVPERAGLGAGGRSAPYRQARSHAPSHRGRCIFTLTQRERITLGVLAQTEGMTARELSAELETDKAEDLTPWLGRLQTFGLVLPAARPQACATSWPRKACGKPASTARPR